MTNDEHPTIKAIRSNAEKAIEKAKREIAVLQALPVAPKMIVLQSDCVWVCHSPDTWSEVVAIMETYAPFMVPFYDYRGTFHSQTPVALYKAKENDEILGTFEGRIDTDGRCAGYISADNRFTMSFYADVPNVGLCSIRFESSANYFDKLPMPLCLHSRFEKITHHNGRHSYSEWSSRMASVPCDKSIAYATGADKPGMARNDVHLYLSLSTLIELARSFAAEFERKED